MFGIKAPTYLNQRHIKILRASATRKICGILAGEPVRALTHWYSNKTYPCCQSSRVECPLCAKSLSKRYYVYYPVLGPMGTVAAVELTATAEAQLMDHLKMAPASTMIKVIVSRLKGKRNNPLSVDAEFETASDEQLLKLERVKLDPDLLKRALCRLWDVPEWDPSFDENYYHQMVSNYITEIVEGKIS